MSLCVAYLVEAKFLYFPNLFLHASPGPGDVAAAKSSILNYFKVWRQYGFTPESYNIPQVGGGRGGRGEEGGRGRQV